MRENTERDRRARKRGAVRGAALFLALQALTAALLLWCRALLPGGGFLSALLLLLAAADLLPVIPTAVVLRQRMKEIEGGELDAARKY